jgi:hypothetical protein
MDRIPGAVPMTKTTTRAFRPVLAAALLAGVGGGFAGAGAQTVHRMALDVDGGEDVISRHIYGHFAEHLAVAPRRAFRGGS